MPISMTYDTILAAANAKTPRVIIASVCILFVQFKWIGGAYCSELVYEFGTLKKLSNYK